MPNPQYLEETKSCPFCAETIKAAAVVCRYCSRDLNSKSKQLRWTNPINWKKDWLAASMIVTVGLLVGWFVATPFLNRTEKPTPSATEVSLTEPTIPTTTAPKTIPLEEDDFTVGENLNLRCDNKSPTLYMFTDSAAVTRFAKGLSINDTAIVDELKSAGRLRTLSNGTVFAQILDKNDALLELRVKWFIGSKYNIDPTPERRTYDPLKGDRIICLKANIDGILHKRKTD